MLLRLKAVRAAANNLSDRSAAVLKLACEIVAMCIGGIGGWWGGGGGSGGIDGGSGGKAPNVKRWTATS